MNKLMLAATLIVSVSAAAFAECGTPDPTPTPVAGALAYDFKASVKTVDAKSTKVKQDCDDPLLGCYRVKSSRSIKGLWIACDCESFIAPVTYMTSNKTKDKYGSIGTAEFTVLNYFGKVTSDLKILSQVNTAQGYVTFSYTDFYLDADLTPRVFNFAAAGMGSVKNGLLQGLSGNIVGVAEPAMCIESCDTPTPAVAYAPCDLSEDDSLQDVAYGSWSIKYNKSMSALAGSSGEDAAAAKKFPKTIFFAN